MGPSFSPPHFFVTAKNRKRFLHLFQCPPAVGLALLLEVGVWPGLGGWELGQGALGPVAFERRGYKNKTRRVSWADPAGWKRGGYLLSHFRSTIGVAGFNFSVRNGKRWSPRAIATLISLQCQGWS